MLGLNPMMISLMIKGQLDEICQGKAPEGMKVKENTENKIVLVASELLSDPEIELKNLNVEIVYKNKTIILSHE